MWADAPADGAGLAALYTFKADAMYTEPGGKVRAPRCERHLKARCLSGGAGT